MRSRRPDFLIIGSMKSATTTLHEQLALQPGIFMSTPKEPNFFSDDAVYAKGLAWYDALFARAAEGDLCGESSTHYTKLPTHPRTIERVKAALGDGAKFIYLMRHPIDRLVSQYIHEWTERTIDVDIDTAVVEHRRLVEYSRYSEQLRPWLETFGRERVLPVFFDSIVQRPQLELERVCRFIGYRGAPSWDHTLDASNVSSMRLRKNPVRDWFVHFPPFAWARKTMVPQPMRDRVKSIWMMRERPRLSDASRAALEAELDEDLARLGEWLGAELCCRDFKAATSTLAPAWTERVPERTPAPLGFRA